MNKLRAIASILLLVTCALASSAQRRDDHERYRGRWEYLGQAHADGRHDHDRIVVNNGERFRALQLGIKGGDIDFERVVVHFENGQDHDVQFRERVRSGEKTRAIDLPGDRRRIRSVEFWYGKAGWGRSRPTMNLWGLR